MYGFLDKFLEEAKKNTGYLRHQKALIGAIDTFLRKPAIVTKAAPHIRDAIDTKRYMSIVVFSLLPCLLFGIWNVGRSAYISIGERNFSFYDAFLEGAIHVVPLVILSYAVGGLCEFIFAQSRGHEIAEGFLVTGMLYPLICPPTIPWWMFSLGIVFGVVVGKEVFGGAGQNVLNPALTARAFLFFAYPANISGDIWTVLPVKKLPSGDIVPATWTTIPIDYIDRFISNGAVFADGFSGQTALAIVAENKANVDSVLNLHSIYSFSDMFFGLIPGSIGETSTLMCIFGAVVLILTKIASWRTMLGVFFGGLFVSSLFCFFSGPSSPSMFSLSFLEHAALGGFAFGAIFMATDPVTGPLHNASKWIYGFLIGSLCILIRLINPAFPEGMMLSILFMNIFASLIDYYVINGSRKRRTARA